MSLIKKIHSPDTTLNENLEPSLNKNSEQSRNNNLHVHRTNCSVLSLKNSSESTTSDSPRLNHDRNSEKVLNKCCEESRSNNDHQEVLRQLEDNEPCSRSESPVRENHHSDTTVHCRSKETSLHFSVDC